MLLEIFTLAGAVAFGSIAFYTFWGAALIGTLILILLTENDHWGWSTTLLICSAAALYFGGIFDIVAFAVWHPWVLARDVGIYVAAGIVWIVYKWWRLCRKSRIQYEEAKAKFLKDKEVSVLTTELKVEWTEWLNTKGSYERPRISARRPEASDHKEQITVWGYLWPFSVLGTFFGDWVKAFWECVYEWTAEVLMTISKFVWRGVEKDLASEEELNAARVARYAKAQ
jgi:hypothetical protein